MGQPTPLSSAELTAFLGSHRGWAMEGKFLCRTYEASSFLAGIDFVKAVALLAEKANHHPDIDIRWRKVTLRLMTHDAGDQVTSLDTTLAHACDAAFVA